MIESHKDMFINKMFKVFGYWYALLLLVCSSSLHAAHGPKISLSLVTEFRPPFQFMKDGEVAGFSTQLIDAMLKYTSYSINTKIYPWSRAYNVALKKKDTCIYAIARTPERENSFKWTEALYTTNFVLIGLKSSLDIQIESIYDAKNYRIAALRDDVTHQLLVKHGFIENKNMFIINNSRSMLKLLSSRNLIDLVLTDELSLKYRARYHNIDPKLFTAFLKLNKDPINFYLACSLSTDQKIVDNITNAFKKIKQTGEYDEIVSQWLNAQDYTLLPAPY